MTIRVTVTVATTGGLHDGFLSGALTDTLTLTVDSDEANPRYYPAAVSDAMTRVGARLTAEMARRYPAAS